MHHFRVKISFMWKTNSFLFFYCLSSSIFDKKYIWKAGKILPKFFLDIVDPTYGCWEIVSQRIKVTKHEKKIRNKFPNCDAKSIWNIINHEKLLNKTYPKVLCFLLMMIFYFLAAFYTKIFLKKNPICVSKIPILKDEAFVKFSDQVPNFKYKLYFIFFNISSKIATLSLLRILIIEYPTNGCQAI